MKTKQHWTPFHEAMLAHPILQGEPHTRRKSYHWLHRKAAREEHEIRTRGGMILLKRGEVLAGLEHLAETWGWSVKKVRIFLRDLVAARKIEKRQARSQYASVYFLTDFEAYQFAARNRADEGANDGQAKGRREAREGQHTKRYTGNTVQLEEVERAPAMPSSLLDEFGFDIPSDLRCDFHTSLVCWGLKREQITLSMSSWEHETSDKNLVGEIRAAIALSPAAERHHVEAATLAAINTVTCKQRDEQDRGADKRAVGPSAALGYFRKVLQDGVRAAMLGEANLQAKAKADHHMQTRSLEEREKGLARASAMPGFGRARSERSSFATAEFPS